MPFDLLSDSELAFKLREGLAERVRMIKELERRGYRVQGVCDGPRRLVKLSMTSGYEITKTETTTKSI